MNFKSQRHWSIGGALMMLIMTANPAFAAGLLTPVGQTTSLEIRDHDVRVVVEDGYVVTEVEQVFVNNAGVNDAEAIYTFPLPERGMVAEFTYWIDGDPVTGEVVPKKKARDIYESEKAAGRETALVEKDEFRDFEISVYPVRAGQDVRTRLVYLQTAHTDTGIGRYSYPLEEGGVDEQANAFWSVKDNVTGRFSFTMDVKSSYPIEAVRLPGRNRANVSQMGPGHWRVSLNENNATSSGTRSSPTNSILPDTVSFNPAFDLQVALLETAANADSAVTRELLSSAVGVVDAAMSDVVSGSTEASTASLSEGLQNRPQAESDTMVDALNAMKTTSAGSRLNDDIIVYWRHQDGLPGSVDLVTWKPESAGVGTFMMTLTPGDDLPLISKGRDWIFVLDKSGSMSSKYATLTTSLQKALNNLPAEDRFRIITFNNQATEMTAAFTPVTRERIDYHVNQLLSSGVGGGTNLYAGLKLGIDKLDSDRSTGIVLITDGVANVGVTQKKNFLELLQQHDVRLYTAIMGNSANRPLLEEMTEVSDGFAMSVANRDDIDGLMMLAASKLTHAAMQDVEIKIKGVRTFDLQPKYIGSVYRGEQLVLLGRYKGGGEAVVRLTASVAGIPVNYETRFKFPQVGGDNPELERLWAYRAIEHLQSGLDYLGADSDVEQGITDLAVRYGLVTDYTSMLVVREEVFQANGIDRTNRDRVEQELKLREQRAGQSSPANRQVDQSQPMFNKSRPATGGSGGGALSPVLLFLLLFGARKRFLK